MLHFSIMDLLVHVPNLSLNIKYQNLLESQPTHFLVENIDKNILRVQISLSKYVKM